MKCFASRGKVRGRLRGIVYHCLMHLGMVDKMTLAPLPESVHFSRDWFQNGN